MVSPVHRCYYLNNLFIECTKIEQLSYRLLLITINFEDINNPCQLLVLSWLTSYGVCFDLQVDLWSCKLTISYVKKISKLDFYNFLPSAFIWKVNIVSYQLKSATSLQLSYHRTLSQSQKVHCLIKGSNINKNVHIFHCSSNPGTKNKTFEHTSSHQNRCILQLSE